MNKRVSRLLSAIYRATFARQPKPPAPPRHEVPIDYYRFPPF